MYLSTLLTLELLCLISYCRCFTSDRAIKVWSMEGVAEDVDQQVVLKAKAVVGAYDKEILLLSHQMIVLFDVVLRLVCYLATNIFNLSY